MVCTGLKSELAVLVLDVNLPRRTGSRSRPMLPFSQPPSRASSVAPSETRSDVFPSQALRYNPPPPPPNLPATVCAAQKPAHEVSPISKQPQASSSNKRQFQHHSTPQPNDAMAQLQDMLKCIGNQMLSQSTSVNPQLTALKKRMNQSEENISNSNSFEPPSSVGSTRSRSHFPRL